MFRSKMPPSFGWRRSPSTGARAQTRAPAYRRLWVEPPTARETTKEFTMGDGTADDLKGRVKEAGGDLTGDDGLKREGKVDQASGSVKDKVGDASDKLKDVVGKD